MIYALWVNKLCQDSRQFRRLSEFSNWALPQPFEIWILMFVSLQSDVAFYMLQWPAKSCRIVETIPAYGQQQSCRYLCWTAQVNIAVYLLWTLFHYIWPILGSVLAYTCSNRSGATAAVLWPLYPWRSAWRWWETGECCNIEQDARTEPLKLVIILGLLHWLGPWRWDW